MSTDFIVFQLGDETFAVDLNKFSIILNPNLVTTELKILGQNSTHFQYKSQKGLNLNLSKIFNLKEIKPTKLTRFLVCECGHVMVGFFVDEIKEFISVDDENLNFEDAFERYTNNVFYLDGEKYRIIDVERIMNYIDGELTY